MAERKFDHGFALDWMRKDLGICLAQADRIGAHLPVTALVDQFYAPPPAPRAWSLGLQFAYRIATRYLILCAHTAGRVSR